VRSLFRLLMVTALALGTAEAQAGTLPFGGSLAIESFANGFVLGTLVVPGSGIATVDGPHINTMSIPASPFAGTRITVRNTMATPFSALQLTVHNGAGVFAGAPLNGVMALGGNLRVCLFATCGAFPANLRVPLSVVGVGGFHSIANAVNETVVGAPWTVGMAAVGTITQMGFQHGPASLASSTASASGQVRLVTPIFVSTNIAAISVLSAFGIMTLHYVPEPGTLLLLCTGIAGLVLFGRTKRS
jgi:hypothetical protein